MENKLILSNNLPEVIKQCNQVNTLPDILRLKVPSIGILSKQFDHDKIVDIIEIQIMDVLDFFNLKTSMSPNQIHQTAELILKAYYWITIPDITLCLQNAKLGQYGKLYAAIDGQVILLWFEKYAIERSNLVEDIAEGLHNERKNGKPDYHPDIKSEILKMLKDKKKEVIPSSLAEMVGPPENIKNAFDEFDRLWKEQDYPVIEGSNVKIVMYKGLNYYQDAFLKLKFEEAKKI